MGDAELPRRYPRLFRDAHVAYADADTTFVLGAVDEPLVNRLHLVCRTAVGVIVCESVEGWRFPPGGTREPGETLAQLASRELAEEAGAVTTGPLRMIGAHRVAARGPTPHRPHLAHPLSSWAFAAVPGAVVGPPSCPPDGETVVAVHQLAPAAAAAWLATGSDPEHADIVRLAGDLGLV